MFKALFIRESHRNIEFDSMISALEETGNWKCDAINVDAWGYNAIADIVGDMQNIDMLIVHESGDGEPDGKTKAPLILTTTPGISFLDVSDIKKIIIDEDVRLSLLMLILVLLAVENNKTIMIIPGRGDDSIDPTYLPPKCWFDRITNGDRTYFYKYNVKGGVCHE